MPATVRPIASRRCGLEFVRDQLLAPGIFRRRARAVLPVRVAVQALGVLQTVAESERHTADESRLRIEDRRLDHPGDPVAQAERKGHEPVTVRRRRAVRRIDPPDRGLRPPPRVDCEQPVNARIPEELPRVEAPGVRRAAGDREDALGLDRATVRAGVGEFRVAWAIGTDGDLELPALDAEERAARRRLDELGGHGEDGLEIIDQRIGADVAQDADRRLLRSRTGEGAGVVGHPVDTDPPKGCARNLLNARDTGERLRNRNGRPNGIGHPHGHHVARHHDRGDVEPPPPPRVERRHSVRIPHRHAGVQFAKDAE